MIDQNELQKLWEQAHKETLMNIDTIKEFIQAKTDKKLVIRGSVEYYKQPCEVYVGVEFFNEETGKTDFGSDFSIYYKRQYSKDEPKFEMGCGTIGSYSREERPYQIDRMRLMLKLWDSEEELVSLFNSLPRSANDMANAMQRQADKEEAEAKKLAAKQKEQEVRSKIKVGYTFEDNQDNGNFKYTITKITPKRVYLDLVHSYKSTHGIWEAGEFTGSRVVLVRCPKSGYIETECLVNELIHLGENYYNVAESLKGVCIGNREIEELEFIPATEMATEIL